MNDSTWRRKGRHLVRDVLSEAPGGKQLLQRYRFWKKQRDIGIRDPKELFDHYYKSNAWGDEESISGPGSTLLYTANIRKELPRLVAQLEVGVFLDAPCGDYNWLKETVWSDEIIYIGGDIVDTLVERNSRLFGKPKVRFTTLDIVNHPLPKADLWLCRDCWFHLPNRDIASTINNFLRSDIRYLLTTTHIDCRENIDIPTGAFRRLNLQVAPFHFPEPVELIDDWIEGFPVSHLGLWRRESLEAALASNSFIRKHGLRPSRMVVPARE
jgi:hypothetical protein